MQNYLIYIKLYW